MPLFEVEITTRALVYADDCVHAEQFVDEIERTECDREVFVSEITRPNHSLPTGWDKDCFVYHEGRGNLQVRQVWPQAEPDPKSELPSDQKSLPLPGAS